MSSQNDSVGEASTWDPFLDAVVAAPNNHKVLFENDRLRVLEVTLQPYEEEPLHHHRWPCVFVLDQVTGPIHHFSPDGAVLPPNPDVVMARKSVGWTWMPHSEDGAATGRTRIERLR
jgi:hypothetical protein